MRISWIKNQLGIWLRILGNAAYVACLPLLCQRSKWLNGKSVWLVFRVSWVWIPAGSQIISHSLRLFLTRRCTCWASLIPRPPWRLKGGLGMRLVPGMRLFFIASFPDFFGTRTCVRWESLVSFLMWPWRNQIRTERQHFCIVQPCIQCLVCMIPPDNQSRAVSCHACTTSVFVFQSVGAWEWGCTFLMGFMPKAFIK